MVSSLKVLYDPETDIMRDVKTVYNLLRCVLFQWPINKSIFNWVKISRKKEYVNINMRIKYVIGLLKLCSSIIVTVRSAIVFPVWPVGTAVAGVTVGGLTVLNGFWQIQDALDDP